MNSRATATPLPLDPGADHIEPPSRPRPAGEVVAFSRPLTALVVVPTLHAGAADAGAIDLVRILDRNGHRAIVVSNGGRLEGEIAAAGAEFVRLDVASFNPIVMLRCRVRAGAPRARAPLRSRSTRMGAPRRGADISRRG